MSMKFTWFPKLTAALEKMPESPRGIMAWAIIQYGTNGVEPDFGDEWALATIFESLREDIDNSIKARNQNKGGRPPKTVESTVAETAGSDDAKPTETGVSEPKNGGLRNGKPTETGVSEPENPSLYTKPYQSIPSHTKPEQSQSKPVQRSAVPRAAAAPEGFEPPSPEECRAYFEANTIAGDPEAFWAFYASQGWTRSNGLAVTDWHALALTWAKRQRRIDADARSRGKPTASEVEAATFKPVRTPEQTLSELEARWSERHPGTDPERVGAPRGTTADRAELELYQDARRLVAARAACERRAS